MVEFKASIIGGVYMTVKGRKHFGDAIIDEVLKMKNEGKSNSEICERFGLSSKRVIVQLINRYHRKQRLMMSGVLPRKIGRPRKSELATAQYQDNIIKQLKMENELLRSFLSEAGRR